MRQVRINLGQYPPLRASQRERQRGDEAWRKPGSILQWLGRIALDRALEQLQRELVGEQFLERQATLRRVCAGRQFLKARAHRWVVHEAQRLHERGEMEPLHDAARQQVRGTACGKLV